MSDKKFPSLKLSNWIETRDTLQKYCRMVGTIREYSLKPHPHWWHISLRVSERGLTTTPIIINKNNSEKEFEIILDLQNHKLIIESNYRELKQISLTGQSLSALCNETCSLLHDLGLITLLDKQKFMDGKPGKYDKEYVDKYWQALKEINRVFNKFRDELDGKKSPVQLWPHHFDLSMSWFSGRLIPGKDPADVEASEEQIMFGFTTGDELISDPYFYITVYPVPENFPDFEMPDDAQWHTDRYTGGILMYDALVSAENPEEKLLGFFRTFQKAGSDLMK